MIEGKKERTRRREFSNFAELRQISPNSTLPLNWKLQRFGRELLHFLRLHLSAVTHPRFELLYHPKGCKRVPTEREEIFSVKEEGMRWRMLSGMSSRECAANSLRFATINFWNASRASFMRRLYGPRWTATAASPPGVWVAYTSPAV